MTDGETLKQFIDNQPKSKISIAQQLGISKQTLFQYFKSQTLESETKAKFEKLFSKPIFTERKRTEVNHNHFPLQNNDVQYTESLKAQIKILENHCSFLQRTYEEKISSLETNLKESLSNQVVMMRQIAVLTRFEAERYSAGDKKKLHDEMDKINKAIDAVMS